MADDTDRSRGVLTPADRAFLRGEREFQSKQSQRDARLRIRNRIENSILDFRILFDELEERDSVNVFSSDSVDEKEQLQDGIINTLAFLYRGCKRAAFYPVFETMLRDGVKLAEIAESEGEYQYVEVNLEVKNIGSMSPEEVLDKLRNEDIGEVSDAELRAFVKFLSEEDALNVPEIEQLLEDRGN